VYGFIVCYFYSVDAGMSYFGGFGGGSMLVRGNHEEEGER
jgi:hypothetical protein